MLASKVASFRPVSKIVKGDKTLEGGGFQVTRPIGGSKLSVFDPYLLLDEFGPVNYKPKEAKGA
jgi:hypothetical protein